MTKTIWAIKDVTDNTITTLVYYHFLKNPKFPTQYMKENHKYEIEMLWNFKLIWNAEVFLKCLTHFCSIINGEL